jgi:hypothetical protein
MLLALHGGDGDRGFLSRQQPYIEQMETIAAGHDHAPFVAAAGADVSKQVLSDIFNASGWRLQLD